MQIESESFDAPESLDTPESRALFRAFGRLPDMKRGQKVWVEFNCKWRSGEIQSRLPGQVFWVKLDEPVDGFKRIVLSVANFGGRWNK